MKKLFLRDGKLLVGEFPEEPKWHEIPATPSGCDYEIRDEQRDEYNAAVSAAKDSAVEIVNPEAIIIYEPTGMVLEGVAMYGDDLYDLPQGWTVEIGYQFKAHKESEFTDCHVSVYQTYRDNEKPHRVRKIARLVPDLSILESKASGTVATGVPERDTTANDRTEPTVNTIIDRIGELYEGLKDLHHAQEVYDKSGEFFASLQELRNIACVAVKSVSPPPQAESRHKYEPEPEHPQFCRQCGYGEHVKLKHL